MIRGGVIGNRKAREGAFFLVAGGPVYHPPRRPVRPAAGSFREKAEAKSRNANSPRRTRGQRAKEDKNQEMGTGDMNSLVGLVNARNFAVLLIAIGSLVAKMQVADFTWANLAQVVTLAVTGWVFQDQAAKYQAERLRLERVKLGLEKPGKS